MRKLNGIVLLTMLAAGASSAQDYGRRANIMGGDPAQGRCTVEVVVDGAAEVDVRGDGARIRTLRGAPAEFRRFDCSAPIPRDAREFRYAPVSGRGRQRLVSAPIEDGPAIVNIEDPQSGAGVYVFDLFWRGRPREEYRRDEAPSPSARAIARCQDRVQDRLTNDGWRRIEIRAIRVDQAPGRGEWIVGRAFAERREGPRELEFSCNVDMRDGDVRSVDVRPR